MAGAEEFARAVTEAGDFSLQTRASGEFGYLDLLDVVRDGKVLATIKRGENAGYAHNAYTFTPDGKTVIAVAATAFSPPTISRGAPSASSSDIRATSGPLPFLPTGAGSSPAATIRPCACGAWRRMRMWLAVHGENGEWVLWTPQGYYAASPSGDAHVGWHVNEGEGKLARFVSAAQLKSHFYRPDIVTRALILAAPRVP